jgi:hypothetical protein
VIRHVSALGVDALLVVAGLAVLAGLGVLERSPRRLLAALGLAFMVGTVAVLLVSIALMTVAVPFGLPTFVLVVVAVTAAGVALALARAGRREGGRFARPSLAALLGPPQGRAGDPASPRAPAGGRGGRARAVAARLTVDGWATAGFVVVFGAFALVGLAKAAVTPLVAWDAWTMWMRKATVIYYHGGVPPEFFSAETYRFTSPDYPLLVPLFEAVHFHAMGALDSVAIHVQFWLLLVAFFWAAAFLANRVTRPALWGPVLLLAALAPGVWGQMLTLYADVPMATFLALGVLALGLWVAGRRPADLGVAGVLLAGAGSAKNEGLMAAIAALLVAGVVVLASDRRRRALRPLGLAAAAFVALIAPWRLWTAWHGVEGIVPVGKGLNPLFLAGRIDRVLPAVDGLVGALDDEVAWTYLLPLALAVVLAALIAGVARGLALYYLGSIALVSALIVWAYWISPTELGWHIGTSVGRVSTTVVFVAIAGLLHLSGELEAFGAERRRPGATAPR